MRIIFFTQFSPRTIFPVISVKFLAVFLPVWYPSQVGWTAEGMWRLSLCLQQDQIGSAGERGNRKARLIQPVLRPVILLLPAHPQSALRPDYHRSQLLMASSCQVQATQAHSTRSRLTARTACRNLENPRQENQNLNSYMAQMTHCHLLLLTAMPTHGKSAATPCETR